MKNLLALFICLFAFSPAFASQQNLLCEGDSNFLVSPSRQKAWLISIEGNPSEIKINEGGFQILRCPDSYKINGKLDFLGETFEVYIGTGSCAGPKVQGIDIPAVIKLLQDGKELKSVQVACAATDLEF